MIESFFANSLVDALLVSLVINSVMFLIAFRLQSDKLTDISYAATFATIAVWAFIISDGGRYHILLLVMVLVWALRLGGFLLYRVIGSGKDARFDEMRHNFVKFGKFWLAQAVTVWVLMITSVFGFTNHLDFTIVSLAGVLIWAVGLMCESAADFQKLAFTKNPHNKNKWIASGIWSYSRHPNYFGEILIWIGMYLYVVSSLSFVEGIVALISPLFITAMLLFVSGIPILEKSADKRWGDSPAYRRYKKQTSILILWPHHR